MCNFLWRINELIKHLLLNKPTNMDERTNVEEIKSSTFV